MTDQLSDQKLICIVKLENVQKKLQFFCCSHVQFFFYLLLQQQQQQYGVNKDLCSIKYHLSLLDKVEDSQINEINQAIYRESQKSTRHLKLLEVDNIKMSLLSQPKVVLLFSCLVLNYNGEQNLTCGTSSLSDCLSVTSLLYFFSNSREAARIMITLFRGIDGVL